MLLVQRIVYRLVPDTSQVTTLVIVYATTLVVVY